MTERTTLPDASASATQSAQQFAEQLAAGEAALAAGRHREAATLLEPALHAFPGNVGVARMVATAWQLAGRRHRARRALVDLVETGHASPDITSPLETLSTEDLYALGAHLLDTGAPAQALRCFERVARALPGHPSVLGAMAGAHRALGDLEDAWRLAQRATSLDKTNPALWLTAAQIRHGQGQLDEALRLLKKAESLRPGHGPTRLQRALTRLLGGVSSHGWADFEHRGLPTLPAGSTPWQGEPLEGRSILVVFEQGIGDLFHFVRFAPLLAARGAARVIVEAPPAAVSLLRASGFDAVAVGEAQPTDFCVPVLSLPYRLGTDRETLDEMVPYLGSSHLTSSIDESAGQSEAGPAMHGDRPRRLGLVLRGNPDFLATNLRDIDDDLVPALQAIPGVTWVWMQLGETPPAGDWQFEIPELSVNWLETASLLSSLDGLVSVDTGLAHLAGAMGLPLWVLLPYSPDWRWGLRRDTTSWYPSARLVRQPSPRDWAGAVERLGAMLSTSAP